MVPPAATENKTFWPAVTVWLCGWVVSVRIALTLVTMAAAGENSDVLFVGSVAVAMTTVSPLSSDGKVAVKFPVAVVARVRVVAPRKCRPSLLVAATGPGLEKNSSR